jgi:hypothetical protein
MEALRVLAQIWSGCLQGMLGTAVKQRHLGCVLPIQGNALEVLYETREHTQSGTTPGPRRSEFTPLEAVHVEVGVMKVENRLQWVVTRTAAILH